jgi:DNA-directed RNA polymerase subunit H (RpoH/RPB5)
MASILLLDYYKIINTAVEMLMDRGYPEDELRDKYYQMDMDDLLELIKEGSLQIQVKHPKEKRMAIVHFYNFNVKGRGDAKLKKDDIMQIIQHTKQIMEKGIEYDVILVTKEKLNSQILNRVADINSLANTDPIEKMMYIETFIHDELKYNVSRHFLVPKHTKCESTEIKKLMEKFNITVKDLPKISREDPQARYLGLRQGEICRITRISPTAGEEPYYRLVV